MIVPPLVTVVQADQEASGFAVLPLLTWMTIVVPVGTVAVQLAVLQGSVPLVVGQELVERPAAVDVH